MVLLACLAQPAHQLCRLNHASNPLGGGQRQQVVEEIDVDVRS